MSDLREKVAREIGKAMFSMADSPSPHARSRNAADAAIAAARSQIGKPYDWTGLFGFLSGRDWQKVNRWFCSELATWAIAQGGTRLFRLEAQSRVTPGDLWMISERIDVGLTGSISRATMDIRP